jgi:hypothetical protein
MMRKEKREGETKETKGKRHKRKGHPYLGHAQTVCNGPFSHFEHHAVPIARARGDEGRIEGVPRAAVHGVFVVIVSL